ncbi:MAG: hypothetical protein PVG92_06955 [Holophagae bacterium]|jgi:trans-aconitate 2-methyltransferase
MNADFALNHQDTKDPSWYLDELGSRGLETRAWQTTYHHRLKGEDPVLEWVRGTTLRPVLEQLSEDEQVAFESDYAPRLRAAYPAEKGLTLFPFTRTFVVARRSGRWSIATVESVISCA